MSAQGGRLICDACGTDYGWWEPLDDAGAKRYLHSGSAFVELNRCGRCAPKHPGYAGAVRRRMDRAAQVERNRQRNLAADLALEAWMDGGGAGPMPASAPPKVKP